MKKTIKLNAAYGIPVSYGSLIKKKMIPILTVSKENKRKFYTYLRTKELLIYQYTNSKKNAY
jgi:hypothetical protein